MFKLNRNEAHDPKDKLRRDGEEEERQQQTISSTVGTALQSSLIKLTRVENVYKFFVCDVIICCWMDVVWSVCQLNSLLIQPDVVGCSSLLYS